MFFHQIKVSLLFSERAVNIQDHPDYVPSIFVYNQQDENKKKRKIQRFESAQKRRKVSSKMDAVEQPENETQLQEEKFEPFIILESTVESDSWEEGQQADKTPDDAPKESLPSLKHKVDDEKNLEEQVARYSAEINALRKERDEAFALVKSLQTKCISFNSIKENKRKFKYYTGIDVEKFNSIIELLHRHLPSINKSKLSYKDQLLMT